MTSLHVGYLAICLAAFFMAARSQERELTLRRPCRMNLGGEEIEVPFALEAAIGKCNVLRRVCGKIDGHEESFIIPAGTRLSEEEEPFLQINSKDEKDDPKFITLNGQRRAVIDKLPGSLSVRKGVVELNQTFTVPFLIGGIIPTVPYRIIQTHTRILLRGRMGNEPVEQQFAEHKDGSGEKYTIKIYPEPECAPKTRPTIPAANADNKKPFPSEMHPAIPAANADNRKPFTSEMHPAIPAAFAEYKKPFPSEIHPADAAANVDYNRLPSNDKPARVPAIVGNNKFAPGDQPTSTAANAFSLVSILLVSAWQFAGM